ncbi:MAG: hypothetical protein AABX70_05555 [Nanoarchaeota archaeon]
MIDFCDVKRGQTFIVDDAPYFQGFTEVDLFLRLGAAYTGQRSKDILALEERVRTSVLPWPDQNKEALTPFFLKLLTQMKEAYPALVLPDPIHLIYTNGKDEGDMAYARKESVVFPKVAVEGKGYLGNLENSKSAAAHLFLHELFHVITRANLPVFEQLCAHIGFQKPDKPLDLSHPSLRLRLLSNPDVTHPRIASFGIEDRTVSVLPVFTYTGQPFQTVSILAAFRQRIMSESYLELVSTETHLVPKMVGIEPVLHPRQYVPLGRIGLPAYAHSPEEVLAEAFSHVFRILYAPDLLKDSEKPDKEILFVRTMDNLLRKSPQTI